MSTEQKMTHHLALTIGPIYRTMSHARSTRELWASSFIFSTFMRALLDRLRKLPGAVVLLPDISVLDDHTAYSGAGIWPDRCFLELAGKPDAGEINKIIENALQELANCTAGASGNFDLFKKYIHVHCIYATFSETELTPVSGEDTDEAARAKELRQKSVIFRLNKLLDDQETAAKFIPTGENTITQELDEQVSENLYSLGFEDNYEEHPVLISYKTEQRGHKPRLPNLLEIAVREFRQKSWYQATVENQFSEEVSLYRGQKNKKDELQLEILSSLKQKAGDDFLQRHKYIAIVQADGDGVGSLIAQLGNEAGVLQQFSRELMAFAKSAANTVADFGAVPIYVGGDDLLFVAPLVNQADENILNLLDKLRNDFKNKFTSSEKQALSLSFGLAITYYKHPLEEGLNAAYEQLFYTAKKLETTNNAKISQKKDALAFYLETHSGQGFGTVLHQGLPSFEALKSLLSESLKDPSGFKSGLVYRLRELGSLLEDAVKRCTLDSFFDRHFNELKNGEHWPPFMTRLQQFVQAVYGDYSEIISSHVEHDTFTPQTELIYSTLRFIQFFNAADHE